MKTSNSFKYFFRLSILIVFTLQCINAQVNDTIYVEPGWNLLSLPVIVSDGSKSSLFPSAVSDAFIYQSSYIAKDTLENGFGFWLKFDTADSFFITGESIHRDTINVTTGWNIIGSLTAPVIVGTISSEPVGIINSDFFSYLPEAGYQQTDTLHPGFGYWVKVIQDGSIILYPIIMPCPGIPTVEYEGKTYNTVKIENQCWLRENLDIGTMVNGSLNQTENDTIEKYCYNDDPANCDIYGGLYQWNEAMHYTTADGAQGICPPGWYIPTLSEFQTLSSTVSGNGNALKAIGQGDGDGSGTNTSGFSALLSGYGSGGFFEGLTYTGVLWSSTLYDVESAVAFILENDVSYPVLNPGYKDTGFSVRCIKGEGANLPPSQPSNPNPADNSVDVDTNLTISWTCTDPNNDLLTYNVYFGTDNPPSTIVSSNQADTSLALSNLDSSTTYYWKIVAKDSRGDSTTGPVWSFTTRYNDGGIHCPGLPYVVYEGKTYNTVLIGDQCWLRENLDIGTMIDSLQNPTNNGSIEKYCYRNDPENCNTYGGLYQWNEAMQYTTTPGARGICPSGWHIPTLTEYQILNTTVGNDCNALKAIGQGTGGGAGTNTSGFSALQAGGRRPSGSFDCLGLDSGFWSSTEYDTGYAYFMFLGGTASDISLSSNDKGNGFSFRCVKD